MPAIASVCWRLASVGSHTALHAGQLSDRAQCSPRAMAPHTGAPAADPVQTVRFAPLQVHAQYCVLVRSALPGGGSQIEWRDVGITNRVNVQVTASPNFQAETAES